MFLDTGYTSRVLLALYKGLGADYEVYYTVCGLIYNEI